MTDYKKPHVRPPNKAVAAVKPRTGPPGPPGPPAWPGAPGNPSIITGGMKVEITIGEVKITIEGPMVKVVAVLNWLFGSKEPSSMISSLQLVFGKEVSVATSPRTK